MCSRIIAILIFNFILLTNLTTDCGADQCFFFGKAYNLGDRWYHNIPTDNSICVICNCKQGSKIDCTPKPCPDDCSVDISDQECCRICKEKNQKPEETEGDLESVTRTDKALPCMHNGVKYSDGQSFTSNSTGLSAQRADQCVQCVCKRGLVLCRLKTCPARNCETPLDVLDNCCPVCLVGDGGEETQVLTTLEKGKGTMILEETEDDVNDDDDETVDDDSPNFSVTFYTSKSNNGEKERDCTSSGKRYTHRSSWHPIIGPFGQMECVICKCMYGKIECKRLKCKPKHKLSCSNPVRLPGNCCQTCQNSGSRKNRQRKKWKKNLPEPNDGNYITATQVFSSIEKKLCLPADSTYIVYKSHASTDTSGYYQFAFQDAKTEEVDVNVYSWTFSDGQFGYFATQHLTKSDFLVLSSTFTFQVMGATQKKFSEKFMKRAKRLQKKCQIKCNRRMERLQRNLKLKPVMMKSGSCGTGEIFLKH